MIAATAGCDLAAVIDPNSAARAAFDAPGYDTIDDVDVALDGVIIATPTELHGPNGEAAAARGWHMLIEKPVTNTMAEADRLIAALKAANVTALVGDHRCHHRLPPTPSRADRRRGHWPTCAGQHDLGG